MPSLHFKRLAWAAAVGAPRTPPKPRAQYLEQNNFDLIRLFAAIQVAVGHAVVFLNPRLQDYFGWWDYFPGVPIFFFISGFLVSASWERNSRLRVFALNRFLRIYPALWGVFAFSCVCLLVFYPPFAAQFSLSHFALWTVNQLSIGQDWNPPFLRGFGVGAVNGSLWTIPVELSFYVAIPLFYYVISRLKRPVFFLAMIIGVSFAIQYVAFIYVKRPTEWALAIKLLNLTPIPWIGIFACRIVAQRNMKFLHRLVAGRFLLFLLLYTAVAVLSARLHFYPFLQGNLNWMGIGNFIALLPLILAAAFTCPGAADFLLRRNDISYGIYIYHMPIVNVLLQEHTTGVAGLALALPATLVMAGLSWKLLEKPCLALRHWTLHKRR